METKNYKPFDLAKAKAGAKIMTRDGHEVEIWKFDARIIMQPIIGIVKYQDKDFLTQWYRNGRWVDEDDDDDVWNLDLVMCSEEE